MRSAARVARVRVDPVLEGIHRRDPREDVHDAFQVRAAGAVGLGRGVELLQEFVAQQFHAHRGHLAELDRRAAVGVEILVARGQRVEGVAGFVQDGLHVPLQADGVHEDERHARLGEGGLVAARRFALAVGQVEQPQVAASAGNRRPAQRRGGRRSPACARPSGPPARTGAAAGGSAGPPPDPRAAAAPRRAGACARPAARAARA